jgi:putative redox protein
MEAKKRKQNNKSPVNSSVFKVKAEFYFKNVSRTEGNNTKVMSNIKLKYYQKDLIFQAESSNGYPLLLGQTAEDSKIKAIRPMELLLMGLASCSSVDIVKIVKKQKQTILDYRVEVNGKRHESLEPSLFEIITLKFILEGDISPLKVERAVNLSIEKYCSVAKILEETAQINYKIELNGKRL